MLGELVSAKASDVRVVPVKMWYAGRLMSSGRTGRRWSITHGNLLNNAISPVGYKLQRLLAITVSDYGVVNSPTVQYCSIVVSLNGMIALWTIPPFLWLTPKTYHCNLL